MNKLECVPLAPTDDLESFDCGNVALNLWLRGHALSMQKRRYSRVFIVRQTGDTDSTIVGFFALSAMSVQRPQLQPTHQRAELREVPAILLGKFALDKSVQGRGLSAALLAAAVDRVGGATRHIGARLLVADPVDERARRLYARHGFVMGPAGRMYARMGELLTSIAASAG